MNIIKIVSLTIFSLFLFGCATIEPMNRSFASSGEGMEHAVIKTLNGKQRSQPSNNWNPYNKNNWETIITGILKDKTSNSYTPIQAYSAILDSGSYTVQIRCSGKGFFVWRDVELKGVLAGHEYLLECYGISAHAVEVKVHNRRIQNEIL